MNLEKDNQSTSIYFTSRRLAIIGLFTTIIAAIIAYYFFLESQKLSVLTYYIHPVKAIVIDSTRSSKFEIYYDGKEIKSSITTVQIAIWNEGNLAIKMDDVLKDIIIKTKNGTPILEATIRNQTRDVINFKLDSQDIQNGRLGVRWKILEESDGGIIQITYIGSPNTLFEFEGIVEVQGQIRELTFPGKIKNAMEQYTTQRKENKRFGIMFAVLFLVYSLLFLLILKVKRKSKIIARSKLMNKLFKVLTYAIPLLIIMIGVASYYFLYYKQTPNPPFGF